MRHQRYYSATRRYCTKGENKRVRSKKLYHFRQCSIVEIHARIVYTAPLFALWRTTLAKSCENRTNASRVWCKFAIGEEGSFYFVTSYRPTRLEMRLGVRVADTGRNKDRCTF